MAALKSARVLRSGASVANWNYESNYASQTVDAAKKEVHLQTDIASKGGGTTQVRIEYGIDDIKALLRELAEAIPDLFETFAECAALANKRVVDELETLRRGSNEQREIVAHVLNDLHFVVAFVGEQACNTPAGEDVGERKARADLNGAVAKLREVVGD